jgi:hypothetical protein
MELVWWLQKGFMSDSNTLLCACVRGLSIDTAAAGPPLLGRCRWAAPLSRRMDFHTTDVRDVHWGALQVRLDRRGRHRRAAPVALSRYG